MYTCKIFVYHKCPHKLTTDSLNYTKYYNTHKKPQPLVRSIYSWHWHTIIIKEWHTLGLFSSSDFWSSGNLLNLRSKIHLCSCLSSMQKFLRVRLTIQHLLPQVILMRKAPPSSSPTTWWKFSCSSSLKHACQTDKSLMRHVNWQNRSIKYWYKASTAWCVQLRISQTPSKSSVYYSLVKLLSSDQYIET